MTVFGNGISLVMSMLDCSEGPVQQSMGLFTHPLVDSITRICLMRVEILNEIVFHK